MKYHVLTLFPDMIENALHTSITGRAVDKGLLSLNAVNIRDFAEEKRKGRIDDYPYGGGAGMVMQAEPVYQAYLSVINQSRAEDGQPADAETGAEAEKIIMPDAETPVSGAETASASTCSAEDAEAETEESAMPGNKKIRVLYMSPQGRRFDQNMARELAGEKELVFLCGHYEGIDERVLSEIVTDEVSIGDYVLTGGELAALVIMDTVARLIPGVLNNDDSATDESFQGDGLLEYPQYSRPEIWRGREVPPILLSGNHGAVDRWRRERSLERTAQRRPDLCSGAVLDKKDRKFILEKGLEEFYPEAKKPWKKKTASRKGSLTDAQEQTSPETQTVPQAQTVPESQTIPQAQAAPESQTVPHVQTVPESQTVPQAQTVQTHRKDPAMIRNIIFDVGYVLFEYRWKEYFMEFGYDRAGAVLLGEKIFGEHNGERYWEKYDFGLVSDEEAREHYLTTYPEDRESIAWYFDNQTEWCVETEDLVPLIPLLKNKGYRIYLLTNYPTTMLNNHLEAASFWKNGLVDGKVVSGEEKMGKPDPAFFRILLDRYGLTAEECLFLDDRKDNTDAAKALGFTVCTLDSPEARREAVQHLKELPELSGS